MKLADLSDCFEPKDIDATKRDVGKDAQDWLDEWCWHLKPLRSKKVLMC